MGSPSIYCGNEGRLDTGKGKRPFVVGVGGGGGGGGGDRKKKGNGNHLNFRHAGRTRIKNELTLSFEPGSILHSHGSAIATYKSG